MLFVSGGVMREGLGRCWWEVVWMMAWMGGLGWEWVRGDKRKWKYLRTRCEVGRGGGICEVHKSDL